MQLGRPEVVGARLTEQLSSRGEGVAGRVGTLGDLEAVPLESGKEVVGTVANSNQGCLVRLVEAGRLDKLPEPAEHLGRGGIGGCQHLLGTPVEDDPDVGVEAGREQLLEQEATLVAGGPEEGGELALREHDGLRELPSVEPDGGLDQRPDLLGRCADRALRERVGRAVHLLGRERVEERLRGLARGSGADLLGALMPGHATHPPQLPRGLEGELGVGDRGGVGGPEV